MPATMTRGAYTGGAIGRLFALDAETGTVRWSFDTVDSTDLWGDALRFNNQNPRVPGVAAAGAAVHALLIERTKTLPDPREQASG